MVLNLKRQHAEGETLSLKLIEAGICKQLLQIDHADYLQQAVDILVLLLNRGHLAFVCI